MGEEGDFFTFCPFHFFLALSPLVLIFNFFSRGFCSRVKAGSRVKSSCTMSLRQCWAVFLRSSDSLGSKHILKVDCIISQILSLVRSNPTLDSVSSLITSTVKFSVSVETVHVTLIINLNHQKWNKIYFEREISYNFHEHDLVTARVSTNKSCVCHRIRKILHSYLHSGLVTVYQVVRQKLGDRIYRQSSDMSSDVLRPGG